MEPIRRWANPASVPALICALAFISIHFAPALSSVCIAAAAGIALYHRITGFWNFRSAPLWIWIFPAYFLLLWLLNVFHTGNLFSGSTILLRNLPLLIVPLFYLSGRNSGLSGTLIVLPAIPLSWISLAGIANYLQHRHFYDQMILESKPVPVYSLVYHIEFSLILSLTALGGIVYLYRNYRTVQHGLLPQTILLATAVNIIGLHVFSARTGLLAFYAGAAVFVFISGFYRKYRLLLIPGLILVIGVAFLVPTVKNRLINTFEDVSAVWKGKDLNDKSFGQRWEAWQMSIAAIGKAPVTGYGWENARDAVRREFDRSVSGLESRNRITPHNQYLETALQGGLPALILLLVLLGWLCKDALKEKNRYLLTAVLGVAVAMCFESLLERQAGILYVAVYLPFIAGLESHRNS